MDTSKFQFSEWPLDLLIDYALKIHHRRIRENGPSLLALIRSIQHENAILPQLADLFAQSLDDLDEHLMKEENVLFPYLYDLIAADREGSAIAPMHCGTISNPIRVMMMEHDSETSRHQQISDLARQYTAPADASDTYRDVLAGLKEFRANLYEHVHIENDIIFPQCEVLEQKIVM
jgi:regulator of cell morphogenesis and NO signaling